ncbi:hypothetical protein ACJX0J_011822, partial [Zea mays]
VARLANSYQLTVTAHSTRQSRTTKGQQEHTSRHPHSRPVLYLQALQPELGHDELKPYPSAAARSTAKQRGARRGARTRSTRGLALATLVGLLLSARASARLALWLYTAFLRPARPLRRRHHGRHRRHRPLARVPPGRGGPRACPRGPQRRQAHHRVGRGQGQTPRRPGPHLRARLRRRRPRRQGDVLGEFLGELDVDVLVNSAGACYPYARKVVDEELVRNLIRLNVDTVTRVTHVVLP